MRKWFLIFFLVSALYGTAKVDGCREEIKKIDAQIQQLETQKQKHIDLAQKYQKDGDRWKYSTGRIDDAHAAWAKADDERAQAIEFQRQIDLLLERKERIYQFYPELDGE